MRNACTGDGLPISVQKNYCWIWIAVDRDEKKFIDWVLGSRGTITGSKRRESVGCLASGTVMTDYRTPYEEFIPKRQHIQSKDDRGL